MALCYASSTTVHSDQAGVTDPAYHTDPHGRPVRRITVPCPECGCAVAAYRSEGEAVWRLVHHAGGIRADNWAGD